MIVGTTRRSRQRTTVITCDGNSLGTGNGTYSAGWVYNLSTQLLTFSRASNPNGICVGGQTTQDMITRQASFLYPNLISTAHNNIVIAMEVRNDLQLGATEADAYAHMVTYCQNAKSNGFFVIGVNHTPSTGGVPVGRTQPQMETARQNVRAMFLADFNTSTSQSLIYKPATGITYADMWVDVGGDAVMGDVLSCANPLLFTDGTHTTALGASNIATIMLRAFTQYFADHPW